ncbi:MAG TPA: sulfatase [Pirellulales bacterium]|nr:sulfatase [Pirellulales bacterium]
MDRPITKQRREVEPLLALVVALALVLVGCKAFLLPWPAMRPAELARWWPRLALISAQDVGFCALFGLMAWGLLCTARRSPPAIARCGWPLVWLGALATALYGVVSVPVYLYLNVQLSYPLLLFLDEWREIGVSLENDVPWPVWCACLAVPCSMLLAYRFAAGQFERRGFVIDRRRAFVIAALLAAYVGGAWGWGAAHWRERNNWQRRVARSPHIELLASLAAAWHDAPLANLPLDECAAEVRDFMPPSARGNEQEADDGVPAPRVGSPGNPKSKIQNPKLQNVFFLVLESVSTNYLELYGAPYPITPNLKRLARQGLVFENIYAQCPSSPKAMVAILTGTYPRIDTREQTRESRATLPSLADTLAAQGCRTGFFYPASWDYRGAEEFLRSAGFEFYLDGRLDPGYHGFESNDDRWLAREAFRWIDAGSGPFFAMCWTLQTHHPYRFVGEERDYGVSDPELHRYLNAVRESDELIGQIWSEIEKRGLADSTLLVVIGDHGQAFGQHSQRLHTFGLYEENVHVPLIIIHDGSLPVGRRSTIGQQIDLAPTVAELTGAPPSAHWQGRSLLSAARPQRAYFYTVWDPVILGVRDGDEKYFWHVGQGESLFDLAADSAELRDLASQRRMRAKELRRQLAALVAFQQRWLAELEKKGTANR